MASYIGDKANIFAESMAVISHSNLFTVHIKDTPVNVSKPLKGNKATTTRTLIYYKLCYTLKTEVRNASYKARLDFL